MCQRNSQLTLLLPNGEVHNEGSRLRCFTAKEVVQSTTQPRALGLTNLRVRGSKYIAAFQSVALLREWRSNGRDHPPHPQVCRQHHFFGLKSNVNKYFNFYLLDSTFVKALSHPSGKIITPSSIMTKSTNNNAAQTAQTCCAVRDSIFWKNLTGCLRRRVLVFSDFLGSCSRLV